MVHYYNQTAYDSSFTSPVCALFLQDVDVTAELISTIQSQNSQQQTHNDCPKVTPINTNGSTANSSHTDDISDSGSTEATNNTVVSKSLSCSTTAAAASEAPNDGSQYMTATEDTVIQHPLSHSAATTRQQPAGASSVHNNSHIQRDPSEDEHWD